MLHSIAEMISPSSLNEFALVDRNHCLQWEGIEYVTAWFDWTIYQWILIRLNSEVFQCSTWANGQEHMRSWHESQDSGKLWRLTVSWKVKVGKCIRSSTQVVFVREFVLKVLTLDIPPQFTWMRIRRLVPFRIGFCNAAMMQVSIRRSTSPDLAARH